MLVVIETDKAGRSDLSGKMLQGENITVAHVTWLQHSIGICIEFGLFLFLRTKKLSVVIRLRKMRKSLPRILIGIKAGLG